MDYHLTPLSEADSAIVTFKRLDVRVGQPVSLKIPDKRGSIPADIASELFIAFVIQNVLLVNFDVWGCERTFPAFLHLDLRMHLLVEDDVGVALGSVIALIAFVRFDAGMSKLVVFEISLLFASVRTLIALKCPQIAVNVFVPLQVSGVHTTVIA
jgi:hypothetical protein